MVQFLIRHSGYEAHYNEAAFSLSDLKVDGKPTKLLFSKILLFQKDMRRGGLHIKTDSRIDRTYDSRNKTGDALFTIIYLNRMMKKSKPSKYEHIDTWEETPSFLKRYAATLMSPVW